MTEPPPEFQRVLDTWTPRPEVVEAELGPWPAQALAALLDRPAPGPGDGLPPLWHEVYLRRARSTADLAADGHPLDDALVPPLEQRRRMFGGGRITVHEPLRIGDVATRTSSVTQMRAREGRSGWLLLVTELHALSVGAVERVREERDIVYRLPTDVGGETRSAEIREAPVGQPVFTLDPDERLLFCFSALTYNAHRIHYDRRYAVDVEGHRDLLVHGPLLALGAIEAASRVGGPDIGSVAYRLLAPSYPTAAIGFAVDRAEGSTGTVVGKQAGRVKVEASVTWRAPQSG